MKKKYQPDDDDDDVVWIPIESSRLNIIKDQF
jgi:hypothetical protein